MQLFANANRGKDTPVFDDISQFLPHGSVWQSFTKESKFKFTREVAREVMQSLDSLDPWVRIVLEECITDLESAAQ